MSGTPPPGTPPPEVPEEFAAAYRAAYLRALASQTDAPRHVADPDPEPPSDERSLSDEPAEAQSPSVERSSSVERSPSVEPVETTPATPPDDSWAHQLPERVGRLVDGTHRRDDEPERRSGERRPVTREKWFVPLLLALIVLGMVVAAYLLGRVVASTLGG